jgi:hypothetical protein
MSACVSGGVPLGDAFFQATSAAGAFIATFCWQPFGRDTIAYAADRAFG